MMHLYKYEYNDVDKVYPLCTFYRAGATPKGDPKRAFCIDGVTGVELNTEDNPIAGSKKNDLQYELLVS